uniref:Uncharacterized protein n=1 Tax=Arundo donax TaxID=35708 RepID=A0A0A9DLI8_ARUDO
MMACGKQEIYDRVRSFISVGFCYLFWVCVMQALVIHRKMKKRKRNLSTTFFIFSLRFPRVWKMLVR